jgi:phosphoenolpyruvate-protein kinase (PTS system EI component)
MDIAGKIVMLLSADPGYDWVFACGPVGLVTAYGGANSHMTIRAAELNLPAAIGVGEPRFEDLRAASLLLLDGAGCRIQVLR